MTIRSVHKAITNAVADQRVTKQEIDAVTTAVGATVSNGEAKELGSLHAALVDKSTAALDVGTADRISVERGARAKLEAFIGDKNLPVGNNVDAVRDAINTMLMHVRLAPPSTTMPRGIDKLVQLSLTDGPAPLGGWQRSAYVDVAKKRFYLVETRATATDNTNVWGPLALPAAR